MLKLFKKEIKQYPHTDIYYRLLRYKFEKEKKKKKTTFLIYIHMFHHKSGESNTNKGEGWWQKKRNKTKMSDKTSEKMKTDSPPFVHEDLIIEILLKLPTKSVLRLKYLSKSWFSVISDPQFARRHFDAAVAPTYKLLNLVNGSVEAYCVDIESVFCEDSWHAVSVSGFNIPSSLCVVGSCRGFLLLEWECLLLTCLRYYYDFDFVLWNPSTGMHKEIHRGACPTHDVSGMGYDPVDDDIVLVTVTLRKNNNGMIRYFCLRTNCWTCVECALPYSTCKLKTKHGQFWNGAIYWILKCADGLRHVVIAFDVREKRLSEIPLPEYLAILPVGSDVYFLKVVEHFPLCLVVHKHASPFEIWSMKNYKEETVWTKTFVFLSDFTFFLNRIFPVCFTEKEEILAFFHKNKLVKINKKGEITFGKQHSIHFYLLHCGIYRESFIPIPGGECED